MGGYVKKKKDMVFQSVDSLQQIVNVVNEAACVQYVTAENLPPRQILRRVSR